MSLKYRSTGASYVRSTRSGDNSGLVVLLLVQLNATAVAAAAAANLGGSLCKLEAARYISDAPLKRLRGVELVPYAIAPFLPILQRFDPMPVIHRRY